MRPPDMRRPRPACHSGDEANIKITHQQSTASEIAKATRAGLAGAVTGAVLGGLLALIMIAWLDWSLGTEPATVAMAEVAHGR